MDEGNYYPEDQTDTTADTDSGDSGKGKDDYGSESALIPKALLAGKDFKPGDEVVFKIVHMYEDEVEIEYATDDSDNEKSEGKSTMDESMDKMDEMATKEG